MARIIEYTAKDRITPSDLGVNAYEQAARRIGSTSEQTASGVNQLGKSIAELWDQQKFNLQNPERGGGGGLKGGGQYQKTLIGTGNAASDEGPRTTEPESRYSGPNIPAQREIGASAADLSSITAKLLQGQGLTDTQWALYNAERAKQQQAQGWWDTKTGTFTQKPGVAPNPDTTDEEAAKAGFDVDGQPIDYSKQTPGYPWSSSQFGPGINARDKEGNVTGSNLGATSPGAGVPNKLPVTPDWAGRLPTSPAYGNSPVDGNAIINAIKTGNNVPQVSMPGDVPYTTTNAAGGTDTTIPADNAPIPQQPDPMAQVDQIATGAPGDPATSMNPNE
jgi:hypothetical protein